jgi:hypothetical protein
MRQLLSTMALALTLMVSNIQLRSEEGFHGTWMSGAAADVKTFIFKVQSDRFTGLMCGPCDDPATVFRVEDGRILDGGRAAFFVNYDVGGPFFKKNGPYRERIVATPPMKPSNIGQAAGSDPAAGSMLKRVVGDETASISRETTPRVGEPKVSPIEGKWVAAGRVAPQNFILKVRDNTVWGLVCGPCEPDGVFLIDEGTIDGNNITFYINHIDTPRSATRKSGLQRNIMRGTISGNVMKFKWVREGAEDQPGGEITMIGPIR